MSDITFNIAKGRVAEMFNRVDSNDPANSAIIVVPIDRGAVTDATLKDVDTLAAVLALSVTERTTSNWNRKTLTDADLAALAVDDVNDRMPATIPNTVWTPGPTAGAVTDLVICYDNDTTGGTDANILPLVCVAFAITPDGSDVQLNAGDVLRAS